MNYKLHVALVIATSALLTGCATTYRNPNITDPVAVSSQLAIDDGYCTQVSVGAAPVPAIRTYSPSQQSYTISGNATSYNSRSGYTDSTYSGRVESTPSVAQGFSSGFASGASIGAAINAQNAQKRIYHGCMLRLGWTDK